MRSLHAVRCGSPGVIRNGRMPRRIHHTDSFEQAARRRRGERRTVVLAALNVADVARKQHHDAVVAVSELRASMKAKGTAVRAVVIGTLGATSAEAATLGFEPKTRATPTVAVKAGAVEKRAQTRVARHTTGKKQKAAIRSTPATAQTAAKKAT